ncbi:hypothetical protein BASA81_018001 [Batrachochytrium salamandrivorans]|nr:hypothetical protein BASA81_018001 [Batrachochytrium salamandrivorans]
MLRAMVSKSSSSSAALIPGSPAAIKREQDKLTEIVVKQDQVRDELIKAERLLRKRPGQYGKGGGSYRGGEDDSPKTKALKQKVIQLKAELRALRKDKKVAQARVKGQTALPLPKYKN